MQIIRSLLYMVLLLHSTCLLAADQKRAPLKPPVKKISCNSSEAFVYVNNTSPSLVQFVMKENKDKIRSKVEIKAEKDKQFCIKQGDIINGVVINNEGKVGEKFPILQLLWYTKELLVLVTPEGHFQVDVVTSEV